MRKSALVENNEAMKTINSVISNEILTFIKIHRSERNAKIFQKVLLLSLFQISLLYCMFYAINRGPLLEGKSAKEIQEDE